MLARHFFFVFSFFDFIGIKNAEYILIFMKNCKTMKNTIGIVIIFEKLIKNIESISQIQKKRKRNEQRKER